MLTSSVRIEAPYVVGDTRRWHPFFDAAITIDVIMSAVACLAARVKHFFAPLPRHGHVRQLGTMYDNQADLAGAAAFEPLHI
jgi:hypothetical protein